MKHFKDTVKWNGVKIHLALYIKIYPYLFERFIFLCAYTDILDNKVVHNMIYQCGFHYFIDECAYDLPTMWVSLLSNT